MLIIQKSMVGDVLNVNLKGVIDETVDWVKEIVPTTKKVTLSCKGIDRINSLGIKNWRQFFSLLRSQAIQLKFTDFSPPLVSQLGYISNFVEGSELVSICLPFLCKKCNKTTLVVTEVASYKTPPSEDQLPAVKCEVCAGPTEFDEIPEEYFSFITELKK